MTLTCDQLCDILQGIAHIHQLNLAHGDLKPVSLLNEACCYGEITHLSLQENIVLTAQSKRLTAKICDFGSTRDVSSNRQISLEYTFTALYRSPEMAAEEDDVPSPSFAADVWAFGCIAFVV